MSYSSRLVKLYWIAPKDQIFAKGYGFLSLTKNMGKNIGKNISKNVKCKCPQKFLDGAKKSGVIKYAKELLKLIEKGQVKKDQKQIAN